MYKKPSILKPLIILVLTIGAIFYLVGLLNTGNPMWPLRSQPTFTPSRVVIRDSGTVTTYEPGDITFDALSAALDSSFSAFTNANLVPLGLSDETLRSYDDGGLVVEVYYPAPIQFNTPARMDNIDQLLIPMRGRHAGNGYAFVGSDGLWLAGALVMRSDEALRTVLRQLGYLGPEE
jgi:hypothetical protein